MLRMEEVLDLRTTLQAHGTELEGAAESVAQGVLPDGIMSSIQTWVRGDQCSAQVLTGWSVAVATERTRIRRLLALWETHFKHWRIFSDDPPPLVDEDEEDNAGIVDEDGNAGISGEDDNVGIARA